MRLENIDTWDLDTCTLPDGPRQALMEELEKKGYALKSGGCPHDAVSKAGEKQNIWATKSSLIWKPTRYAIYYLIRITNNLALRSYSEQERDGWVSIRGKRGFNSGIHSIDFNVIKLNSSNVSVGVMQQDWEPRIWNFLKDETQNKTCIWTDGMYGDCKHLPFPAKPFRFYLIISFSKAFGCDSECCGKWKAEWKEGSVVGVMMDFDTRKIHYFIDGKYHYTIKMTPDMQTLWPALTWEPGELEMRLIYRREHYGAPAEETTDTLFKVENTSD